MLFELLLCVVFLLLGCILCIYSFFIYSIVCDFLRWILFYGFCILYILGCVGIYWMFVWKWSYGNYFFFCLNLFCKFFFGFFFESFFYVKKNFVCLLILLVVVKFFFYVFFFKDCKWYWFFVDMSFLRVVVCFWFYLKSFDYVLESICLLGVIRFFLFSEKLLLIVCRFVIGLNVVRSLIFVFILLNDWRVCERCLFCCKWNFIYDVEIWFKKFKFNFI